MGFPPLWSRRLYSRDPQLTSAKPAEASLLRQEVILKLVELNGWFPPGIIQGTENEKKGATDEKRHQTEEKYKKQRKNTSHMFKRIQGLWRVTRLVSIHGITAVAFCGAGQKKGLPELHQEA